MFYFDSFPVFSCRKRKLWIKPQNIVDNVDNCVDNCGEKEENAVESLGKTEGGEKAAESWGR